MEKDFDVQIENRHRYIVVRVSGRLDFAHAPDFDRVVEPESVKPSPKIVLDLTALNYLSSAGLRSFVLMGKRVQQNAGRMTLVGVNGIIRDTFQMSGLLSIFETYDSLDMATQLF